jgi:lysophospholipase L1-like esterase
MLPQLADGKRVTHYDINGLFLNDKGLQNQSLFNRDLLHLNKQGYLTWAQYLKPVLEKHGLKINPNTLRKND